MSRLSKRVQKNSVQRFLGSYLLVLLFPMLIITIGIMVVYWSMMKEITKTNQIKMEHSIQLIDNSLSALHSMAVQGTNSAAVKRIAALEQVANSNIMEYKNGIDTLSSILIYQEQGVGFIKEIYLYFNKTNYCFYKETLYRESIFDPYLESWGIDKNEWQKTVVNNNITIPRYVSCNGKLHYIMPINTQTFMPLVEQDGENEGMLVFMLDTDELISYFDYTKDIGDGILYVADTAGNILFSSDENYSTEEAQKLGLGAIIKEYKRFQLLQHTSQNKGWTYYFWVTKNVAGKSTILFLTLAVVAEMILIVFCLSLSMRQAKKMGTPIDQLFALVSEDASDDSVVVKSTERLGEIVAGIVSTNQEMQVEIEESKPLLRKAFLHDLLTLDVTSTQELQYLAENAGININSDEFWVISVRLFSNNDVYDVDEQTLEDVKVIIRGLQKHIEEVMEQDVWFYQRNYLSLLILIDRQERKQILKMAQDTYKWLLSVFSTESVWGISTKCSNIMNLWKHFEEAETARKYCTDTHQIVEYSAEVSDKHAYYFPEMAEEKIVNYLNSGDMKAIKDVLEILEHENLENRKLSRKGFIKLNNKICEMLSANFGEQDSMPYIMKLNKIIVGSEKIKGEEYFSLLEKIFVEICIQYKQMKGIRRNAFIDNIQAYIEKNYANPDMGLATISVVFGISEGYVSSLFKKQTQIGFNEYVEKIRMDKAVNLLKEGDESIEAIAAKVGYNSVQSFRRAFKRVYGTTPKYYR